MNTEIFHTEIIIDSSVDYVWKMLIDLSAYSKWNPWVIYAFGNAVPGDSVDVEVMMNGKPMRASHIVLEVNPNKRFYWKDSGWNSYFVYADRSRDLERLADGRVLLKQTIRVTGILTPLVKHIYGQSLQKGIEDESKAIKSYLEYNDGFNCCEI